MTQQSESRDTEKHDEAKAAVVAALTLLDLSVNDLDHTLEMVRASATYGGKHLGEKELREAAQFVDSISEALDDFTERLERAAIKQSANGKKKTKE